MQSLLSKYQLFRSGNLDFVRQEVAKVYCEHRLSISQGKYLDAQHNHVRFNHISLNYMDYGADVRIIPGELDTFFLLQLPLSGFAHIYSGDKKVVSTAGIASVPAPHKSLSMHWSHDCRQLLVQINRPALEQQLSALIVRPVTTPLEFELLMSSNSNKGGAWWRFILYLVNDLENPNPLTSSGAAIGYTEQMIMTNLLYAQPNNYSEALNARNGSIAPAHVKRAENFMHENITAHLTIGDLTAVTRVSARSLHEGFRRFRGTSPMNYLRSLRLERARQDLLATNTNLSVTDIATKWGFTQLGRFSVTYKKVYGESPSETLRQKLYND